MTSFDENQLPDHLKDLARQMRDERRRPSEAELHELRPRIQRRAAPITSKGVPLKARLVTAVLTLALIGGGGGAVIAASGGGTVKDNGSAASSQYCPPKSPGTPKPKDRQPPGNKCGQP